MFVLNMTFVSIPTFILAAFGILFDNREYVVAEKVVDRKAINN